MSLVLSVTHAGKVTSTSQQTTLMAVCPAGAVVSAPSASHLTTTACKSPCRCFLSMGLPFQTGEGRIDSFSAKPSSGWFCFLCLPLSVCFTLFDLLSLPQSLSLFAGCVVRILDQQLLFSTHAGNRLMSSVMGSTSTWQTMKSPSPALKTCVRERHTIGHCPR